MDADDSNKDFNAAETEDPNEQMLLENLEWKSCGSAVLSGYKYASHDCDVVLLHRAQYQACGRSNGSTMIPEPKTEGEVTQTGGCSSSRKIVGAMKENSLARN